MPRFLSNPVEVIAIQFKGHNADEFLRVPSVTQVYGPFTDQNLDGDNIKSIEIRSSQCDFEIYMWEWAVFYASGRCEWYTDEEFARSFTELYDPDIDTWQNEGGVFYD